MASLFAIVFFTITFNKAISDHHSDTRLRPALWVWLATASVVGPAYLAVSGYDAAAAKGVFYQSMWCIALFFYAILGAGWLRNFFVYEKDNSIWIVPFALTAFAINTIQYQRIVNSQLFLVLSLVTGTIACASNAVCGLHMLSWLVK